LHVLLAECDVWAIKWGGDRTKQADKAEGSGFHVYVFELLDWDVPEERWAACGSEYLREACQCVTQASRLKNALLLLQGSFNGSVYTVRNRCLVLSQLTHQLPPAIQVNKGICKAVLHVHHVVMEASQAVLLIAAFCTCITVGVLLNPQGCSKS